MRKTKQVSYVSKVIAEYVVRHGRRLPSGYTVTKKISDGRKLEVLVPILSEGGNRKNILENIAANAASLLPLMTTLKPSKINPIGYEAYEMSLTGEFSNFSVLIGENHRDGNRWNGILKSCYSRATTGTLRKHIQGMYNELMRDVAVALIH